MDTSLWPQCTVVAGDPEQSRQSKADAGLTAGPVDLDWFIWLDECVRALLANTVLSTERHSVSDGEGFTEEGKKERENERERERERKLESQRTIGFSDSVCLYYIQVYARK